MFLDIKPGIKYQHIIVILMKNYIMREHIVVKNIKNLDLNNKIIPIKFGFCYFNRNIINKHLGYNLKIYIYGIRNDPCPPGNIVQTNSNMFRFLMNLRKKIKIFLSTLV